MTFFERYDLNTWLWWIVFTAAGYTLAMFIIVLVVIRLGIAVLASASTTSQVSIWLQIAVAPIFSLAGAVAGLSQWFSLRSILPRAGWWILATAIGWMSGYLSTIFITPSESGDFPFAAVALTPWLAIGLFTGFCQWIILRHRYQGAGWWVLVTAAAVVIGAGGWIFGSICGGALSWAAAGALTGFLLLWLIQHPLNRND